MALSIMLLNARSVLKLLGGEPDAMVQLAMRIANGDLKDTDTSKSVPGSLQAALQNMTTNLRSLIGNIVAKGRSLTATSRSNTSISGPLLRWSPSLSVGLESIDSQHKTLVDMINELHQKMNGDASHTAIGSVLGKLIDYTDTHFKNEEKLFAEYDYEHKDVHMEIHRKLVAQLVDFQKQYNTGKADISLELMEFLKDWLVDHIKKTDMKYGPFLKSKGVA
ncbi:MAG: bacteriohemerythrin [Thermodesulfobacteriota bacterium]|nr:bacteriohemerythrin [Thermodesulfobacteriota bacterium]